MRAARLEMETGAITGKPIRTLIAEGEPSGHSRLSAVVADIPGLEIVAECFQGTTAIAAILANKPDLVILDVHLPPVDGYSVIEAVREFHKPFVIFTTAFGDPAGRVLEDNAVDYILKPYKREKMEQAVLRVREQMANRRTVAFVKQEYRDPSPIPQQHQRFAIKTHRSRRTLLSMNDVQWLEADGNYVKIYTKVGMFIIRATMESVQQRMPSEIFIRIHRSYIVNADCIQSLIPCSATDSVVMLHDGKELPVGPSYKKRVKALFLGT